MDIKHIALTVFLFLLAINTTNSVFAQLVNPPTDKYLNNVVQITTIQNDVETDHGFGFIVGEQNNKYYIVTANHVVRKQNEDPDDKKEVKIQFYQNQGNYYQATLVSRVYPGVDLALIEIQKPSQSYIWNTQYADTNPINGEKVWFIGRSKTWEVVNEPGYVQGVPVQGVIRVANRNVLPGTSGAPLISDYGIQGMIIEDNSYDEQFMRVLDIETIKTIVSTSWNKPWGLIENQGSKDVTENLSRELEKAKSLVQEEKYEDARTVLNNIISESNTAESEPIKKQAYYEISNCFFSQGNIEEGVNSLRRINELYPEEKKNVVLVLLGQAFAEEERNNYLNAFVLFQKLIDDYPESESAVTSRIEIRVLREKVINTNIDWDLKDVFFNGESTGIRPDDAATALDENALILWLNPNITIFLEGYAYIGEYSDPPSAIRRAQERADSVKEYLVSKGIDPERITTGSGGETDQFNQDLTHEAFQLNRRVHFLVTTTGP